MELKTEIMTCSACGTQMVIINGDTYYCEGCGNTYKVKNAEENNITEIKRAMAKISEMEFDVAENMMDLYIADHTDAYEAYWAKFLAQNKIVYVDDGGKKMVPTFADIPGESLRNNSNFKKACEKAPDEKKEYYLKQISIIEDNAAEWKNVRKTEGAYDVFISYKDKNDDESRSRTQDSNDLLSLYHKLKEKGYRVFFSRESMIEHQGKKYEPYIYNALDTAKVMLVCGSKEEYFNAKWVKNEWTRFLSQIDSGKKKDGVVIPVMLGGMEANALPAKLRKFQGIEYGSVDFLGDLQKSIDSVIKKKSFIKAVGSQNKSFGGILGGLGIGGNTPTYNPSIDKLEDKIYEWNASIISGQSNYKTIMKEIDLYIAYKQAEIDPRVVYLYTRAMTDNYTRTTYSGFEGAFSTADKSNKLQDLMSKLNAKYEDLVRKTSLSMGELDKACPGEMSTYNTYKRTLNNAISETKAQAEKEAEYKANDAQRKHEEVMKYGRKSSGVGDIVSGVGSTFSSLLKIILTIALAFGGFALGFLIPGWIFQDSLSTIGIGASIIINVLLVIRDIKRILSEKETSLKSRFLLAFIITLALCVISSLVF